MIIRSESCTERRSLYSDATAPLDCANRCMRIEAKIMFPRARSALLVDRASTTSWATTECAWLGLG